MFRRSLLIACFVVAGWQINFTRIATAQDTYFWDGANAPFSDASHWSLNTMSPAGPPGAGERALFAANASYTVTGDGSPAQVVIFNNSRPTFTGAINVTGVGSLVNGLEVGSVNMGSAHFTGNSAQLNSTAPVAIGGLTGGDGHLTFSNGAIGSSIGTSTSAAVLLAGAFTSAGTMTIEDLGTQFTSNGSFLIGGRNTASVTVTNQGVLATNGVLALNAAGLNIGGGDFLATAAHGTLNITDGGIVSNTLQTNLGLYGTGIINISDGSFETTDGGLGTVPALSIARFAGSNGELNVSGTGSVLTQGEIIVGGGGNGNLEIIDQGLVESFVTLGAPAIVGFGTTAQGTVLIDGPETLWQITDALVVGQQGRGDVEIVNGGTLFIDFTVTEGAPYLVVGDASASSGRIDISGQSSFLDASFIATTLGREEGAFGSIDIYDSGEAFLQFTVIGSQGIGNLDLFDSGVLATGTAVLGDLPTGVGTVNLDSGASWEVLGQLIIGSGGSGEVYVGDESTLTVGEFIEIGGGIGSFGTITIEGPSATVDGTFNSVTVGTAGQAELYIMSEADWNVDGDVSMALFIGSEATAHVDSFSNWSITGNLYVGGSDTAAGGTASLEIDGQVSVDTQVVVWNDGTVELTFGTLASPSVESHGRIVGDGTIDTTNFVNDGFVSPERSALLPTGLITVTGDYEQTQLGILEIEIGGTVAVTEFDRLAIAGTASLQGELIVSLVDLGTGLFVPALNDEFAILTVGAFDPAQPTYDPSDVMLPSLAGGLAWDIVYTSTELLLRVVAANLPGDYNADGQVDAADYTVWRDTLGSTGGGLAADGNGDLVVDALDYSVWRSNFGISTGGSLSDSQQGSNVPEPGNLALAGLAAVALWLRHSYSSATRFAVRRMPF